MIQTLERPQTTADARVVTWRSVHAGLWAGQIGDDFAGLIERDGHGYVVTDWQGTEVGAYATLADAEVALEPSHRALERAAREERRTRAEMLALATLSLAGFAMAVATLGVVGTVFA